MVFIFFSFWKKTRIYMTRKRLSLNQINLIWSINQPRYIILYKVTHVVYSISNIWWRWILIKKKKKKARKHLFLKQRSCCEFEIDPSGKQRKNVIVTFSFREKISEQTYDSRVPNILAIIHIFENHCYVRIKEIQFPSIFVENITFGEKRKKITIETSDTEHSWTFWKHLTISTSKDRFN